MLAINNNNISLTNAQTDTQVLNMWLSDKAVTTQKTYRYSLKQFTEICTTDLRQVKVDDLINFKEYLVNKNYAIASINNKLMAIKSLLSYCYKIGYTLFNVGAVVKSMKTREDINDKILSESEIKALIASAKNNRDALLIKLMANTGLRISEVLNLKWSDISNGKITVFGKGNKTRFLPIRAELITELESLKNKFCDYIFFTNRLSPLKRENVHVMLKETAKRANIDKNVSAHWLRHSTASHALSNGAELHQVKEMLGHCSINTTARYLHTVNGSHGLDFVNFA